MSLDHEALASATERVAQDERIEQLREFTQALARIAVKQYEFNQAVLQVLQHLTAGTGK